jgi:hypothetical protein
MGDEAAVIDKIDSILDVRNDMIGYKTETERRLEQKITNNVDYITDLPKYEELIRKHPELVDNYEKKNQPEDNVTNLSLEDENTEDYQEIRNCLIGFDSKKEIIQNALAIACDKLNCQAAAIFLFSSKDGLLKRVGIKGIDRNGEAIDNNWFEQESYTVGESFTGRAASPQSGSKYGKTQVCYDFSKKGLKNKKKYFDKLGKLKVAIAMPLNGRNKTYGVLEIFNKLDKGNSISDGVFSESDIDLITFLAGDIASAISNFHRDAENNILRYLKDSLIESDLNNFDYSSFYEKILCFLVGSETAFKAAILRVKNNDSGNMHVRFSSYATEYGVTKKENNEPRKSNQGFVGLVTESRKPQIIEKISKSGTIDEFISSGWVKENKFESFGCFPLMLPGKEEVLGTLSLFGGREYEFHPSSIDFLNNVISSISVLIQKEKKRKENERKFSILVRQWQDETGFMSSTSEAVIHPAYQRIIGMGEEAIPFLLKELTKASGRWFWALKSITGEDPVPEDQRGKTQLMIKAWIEWGKEKGYIIETKSIKNN